MGPLVSLPFQFLQLCDWSQAPKSEDHPVACKNCERWRERGGEDARVGGWLALHMNGFLWKASSFLTPTLLTNSDLDLRQSKEHRLVCRRSDL